MSEFYTLSAHGIREIEVFIDKGKPTRGNTEYHFENDSKITLITFNNPGDTLTVDNFNFLIYAFKTGDNSLKTQILAYVESKPVLKEDKLEIEKNIIINGLKGIIINNKLSNFEFLKNLISGEEDDLFFDSSKKLLDDLIEDISKTDLDTALNNFKTDILTSEIIQDDFKLNFRVYRPGQLIPNIKLDLNTLNLSSGDIIIPKSGIRKFDEFIPKPYYGNAESNILEIAFHNSLDLITYPSAVEGEEEIDFENYISIGADLIEDIDESVNKEGYINKKTDTIEFDILDLFKIIKSLEPSILLLFACGNIETKKGYDYHSLYNKLYRTQSNSNQIDWERKFLKYKSKYIKFAKQT